MAFTLKRELTGALFSTTEAEDAFFTWWDKTKQYVTNGLLLLGKLYLNWNQIYWGNENNIELQEVIPNLFNIQSIKASWHIQLQCSNVHRFGAILVWMKLKIVSSWKFVKISAMQAETRYQDITQRGSQSIAQWRKWTILLFIFRI